MFRFFVIKSICCWLPLSNTIINGCYCFLESLGCHLIIFTLYTNNKKSFRNVIKLLQLYTIADSYKQVNSLIITSGKNYYSN